MTREVFRHMANAAAIAFEEARRQEGRTLGWSDLMRFAAVPLLADLEAHRTKQLKAPGDSWSVQDYRETVGLVQGRKKP